jgi:hypothetical protein
MLVSKPDVVVYMITVMLLVISTARIHVAIINDLATVQQVRIAAEIALDDAERIRDDSEERALIAEENALFVAERALVAIDSLIAAESVRDANGNATAEDAPSYSFDAPTADAGQSKHAGWRQQRVCETKTQRRSGVTAKLCVDELLATEAGWRNLLERLRSSVAADPGSGRVAHLGYRTTLHDAAILATVAFCHTTPRPQREILPSIFRTSGTSWFWLKDKTPDIHSE